MYITFEDTKGVIRSRNSRKDRQHNDQNKDKQLSTNHCAEDNKLSNTNLTKTGGEIRSSEAVGNSRSNDLPIQRLLPNFTINDIVYLFQGYFIVITQQ